MIRALPLFLTLAIVLPSSGARAEVAYEFDITTAFAASDPFANQIGAFYEGDTGYLQIVNSGPSDYNGILRFIANSAYDGNQTFAIDDAFIPAGGSVSIGLAVDSSTAGGFNNFTGSFAASDPGTFRPGIILYLEGGVSGDGGNGAIKIAVQDLDITTGVILTDPNGIETGSFVLQGGDPFGLYNGDAWELTQQPDGHFTFQGVAVPAPGDAMVFGFAALVMARYRYRRSG
jgi:hypothetical protein